MITMQAPAAGSFSIRVSALYGTPTTAVSATAMFPGHMSAGTFQWSLVGTGTINILTTDAAYGGAGATYWIAVAGGTAGSATTAYSLSVMGPSGSPTMLPSPAPLPTATPIAVLSPLPETAVADQMVELIGVPATFSAYLSAGRCQYFSVYNDRNGDIAFVLNTPPGGNMDVSVSYYQSGGPTGCSFSA